MYISWWFIHGEFHNHNNPAPLSADPIIIFIQYYIHNPQCEKCNEENYYKLLQDWKQRNKAINYYSARILRQDLLGSKFKTDTM